MHAPGLHPYGAAAPDIEQLQKLLEARYGKPMHDFALSTSLSALLHAFPRAGQLRGVRILDIGCGAHQGSFETSELGGTWSPWLLRAAAELGAECVGVDIGHPGPQDRFTFYDRIDLSREGALDFLPAGSFDAINCTNLFSSPHLVYRMGLRDRGARERMLHDVEKQIERIRKKPSGIIIAFDKRLDNY